MTRRGGFHGGMNMSLHDVANFCAANAWQLGFILAAPLVGAIMWKFWGGGATPL